MPWTYTQSTGEILRPDGTSLAIGYAGHGPGRNNPALQNIVNVGPIPQGWYTIQKPAYNTDEHGPFVMRLDPDEGNEMHGRAGFLIHGDNARHEASHGCIILPRWARQEIADSPDCELEVRKEGTA